MTFFNARQIEAHFRLLTDCFIKRNLYMVRKFLPLLGIFFSSLGLFMTIWVDMISVAS